MKNITARTATYFAKELKEYLDGGLPSGCVLPHETRSCKSANKQGINCDYKQKKACELSQRLDDISAYN